MKKYNFDNINEFFEELMNKPNAKINMLHVYGAYERDCERIKREQEIEDKYDCLGYNYNVYIITNDIAIVKESSRSRTHGYYAHVCGKKNNVLYPTFEQALLDAISIVMTGREDAAEWMWKLVERW